MFFNSKLFFILFSSLILIVGCGSSVEYSTAKVAIQDKDWAKAEEYLFKALEVEPENAAVMVDIGYYVHSKKREWQKMNEMFDKALAINPAARAQNGRPISEVTKNYRNMFWTESYNNAVRRYNDFKGSNDKTLLDEAITLFNESIEIDPLSNETYLILANSYYEAGNNQMAIESAQKALDASPNDFQPNYSLGQILALTGEKKSAIEYIEKAISIDPANSDAIRQLAMLYYEDDQKEKSIETFKSAIENEQDKNRKADLYYNLGVLNMQLNNYNDADIAFEEAYYLNEEDFEALLGMATLYEQLGDKYFNGTEENFKKDYFQAERWYKKARSKLRSLNEIDTDNQEQYEKALKLIDYKMNISAENQK